MSTDELDHLDAVRGEREKSVYIRDLIAAQAPHRHSRDNLLLTEYVQGREIEVYQCTCGKVMK